MYTKATIDSIITAGSSVELRWISSRDRKEVLSHVQLAKQVGGHITLAGFPYELAIQCAEAGGKHVTIKESYQ